MRDVIKDFYETIQRKAMSNYVHTLFEEVLDLIEIHGSIYKFSNDVQETIQCLVKGDWGLLTSRGGLNLS